MNILFLTQVLPYPLDAGPKVRAYYVLRHLTQRHRVTLASLVRSTDSPEAIAHLRELCADVVTCCMPRSRWHDGLAVARSGLRGEPVLISRDWVPAMADQLRDLLAKTHFDMIHCDQLWMAPYALAAAGTLNGSHPRPGLVLDQHNAVYLISQRLASVARGGLQRLGWRREARLMAEYEARTCLAFDHVVTVSEPDRRALQALYPQPPQPRFTDVIPICIDAETEAAPAEHSSVPPGILFLGGMHWPPNADGVRWFAREVLPVIHDQQPEAVFHAIGRQPPTGLTDHPLAAKGVIQAPGYVTNPEDYWAKSRVFVVPLLAGGGMRVKILDAWARGVPVVSTSIGAEGLDYRDGENLLLADSPVAFAEAVTRVLADRALAARLADAGRRTVRERHDWHTVYGAWESVYPSTPEPH